MSMIVHTKNDKRYDVRLGWCGYSTQQYCIRFCGNWVGHAPTLESAWALAAQHNSKRIGV